VTSDVQSSGEVDISMLTPDVKGRPSETEPETRFAVGWQRLTRQEFLDAITVALLDKVRRHQLEQGENPDPSPNGTADLVD
jgi:hypothetical protein